MTTVKPGYLTTEFWGKLIVQVLGLLTLFGVFTPSPGLGDALVSLITLVGPEIAYAISRGKVKAAAAPAVGNAAQLASATVAAAQAITSAAAQLTRAAPPAPPPAGA